jgi:TonB family protein
MFPISSSYNSSAKQVLPTISTTGHDANTWLARCEIPGTGWPQTNKALLNRYAASCMRLLFVLTLAGLLAQSSSAQITARLSAEPPLSPAEVTQLEAAVRANPSDSQTRLRLLRFYSAFAPMNGRRSPYQNDRLNHILHWIENKPSDPISSSDLMYVPSDSGPFADPADHAAVRDAWIRAVQRQPKDVDVLLNATRFLYREHPAEAEQMLDHVLSQDPANRRVGAHLGFLYALDILGISSPAGQPALRPDSEGQRLQERARAELDRTRNVFVLAGAGTALPNLFPRTPRALDPNGGQSAFELGARLMARARELGPNEPELHGPMPLIREFQAFQTGEASGAGLMPSTVAGDEGVGPRASVPSAVRVGGAVQAAKLVEKPEVVYPPMALQARIQGTVRFNVIVSPEGRVENATLISGHPLLVPAAVVAVRAYRYQPTLLNGVPVHVITQVEVPFVIAQ